PHQLFAMKRTCFQLLSLSILTIAVHSFHMESRIIGGQEEDIENAAWQVALFFNNTFICGGSIYSELFVITAAHCVENKPADKLQIRAGSSQYETGGSLVSVAKTLCHKKGNRCFNKNDIAVLRLKETLTFSNRIKAIPVARQSPNPSSWATVTGWGRCSDEQSTSPTLQAGQLRILGKFRCFLEFFPIMFIDKICANNANSNVCHGDSGGPLVLNGELVGIVSFGRINCMGSSVYVDVAKMRDWIAHAVKTM
ncbi:hypothetical protein KR044_013390, partial [Drosophila immigrans]